MTAAQKFVLLAGALLVPFVVACNNGEGSDLGFPGSSDDTTEDPSAAARAVDSRTQADAAGEAAPASETASATADAPPPAPATTDNTPIASPERVREARAALLQSVDTLDSSTYHVVYDLSMADAAGSYEGKLSLASKDAKSLLSLQLESPSQGNFTFAIIDDGEAGYFCFGSEAGGPSEAGCLQGEAGHLTGLQEDFPLNDFEGELRRLAADHAVNITPAGDRQIGSLAATCYTVDEAGQVGTICFAKDSGFLLLIEGQFAGASLRLVVDTFSENPADSVFEPPYPVTDFDLDLNP